MTCSLAVAPINSYISAQLDAMTDRLRGSVDSTFLQNGEIVRVSPGPDPQLQHLDGNYRFTEPRAGLRLLNMRRAGGMHITRAYRPDACRRMPNLFEPPSTSI